jgi:hypothetical protein
LSWYCKQKKHYTIVEKIATVYIVQWRHKEGKFGTTLTMTNNMEKMGQCVKKGRGGENMAVREYGDVRENRAGWFENMARVV